MDSLVLAASLRSLRLRSRAVAIAVAAMVLAATAVARSHAQVILTADSATVQFIGLRQWTPEALRDSLRRVAPDVRLTSHAVGPALERMLGFAAAGVGEFYWEDGLGRMHGPAYVITVVEPRDSARVRWRTIAAARERDVAWTDIVDAARAPDGTPDARLLAAAAAMYPDARRLGIDSAAIMLAHSSAADAQRARGIWSAMARHAASAALRRATATLGGHPDPAHRLAAVGVLLNFTQRDESWHALVGALRDPDPRVRATALDALGALNQREARRIDWRPAAADLRLLLGGTNVAGYYQLLSLLARTGISRELGPTLLADNAHLLLGYARSGVHMLRRAAWDVLGLLSGRPEAGPVEWERWVTEFLRR